MIKIIKYVLSSTKALKRLIKFSFYPVTHAIHSLFKIDHEKKINLAICGVQRGGTSGLYNYLNQHPNICMGETLDGGDEPKFFDKEDQFSFLFSQTFKINYFNYHSAYFKPETQHEILGTNGPIYMYWQDSIRRIFCYNPKIKILIILRNPIDRAYSQWNKECYEKNESLTFLESIQQERQRAREALPYQHRVFSYIDRGFYSEQLRRLTRFFPENQIHIIKYEELKFNPQETMDKVFNFLNVVSIEIVPKIIGAIPYKSTMENEEKKILKSIFEYEIKSVERLLGWDCSDWLE